MQPDVLAGTFKCGSCGLFTSNFPISINEGERIDEDARVRALKPIRDANFRQLLDAVAPLLPDGASVLDVGCAHGWFLAAATERGYHASGIEPDREMARRAEAAGHPVTVGYFPAALPGGAKFDAITFNDVFEHLPDLDTMVQAIADRLRPGGLVVINLPVSDGLIFRLSRAAARLGATAAYERMWQKGLPSPHLSYFSRATLPRLFEASGFRLVQHGRLRSIETQGLYERIRYDRNVGALKAAVLYGIARAVRLASALAASDIHYFVLRRP